MEYARPVQFELSLAGLDLIVEKAESRDSRYAMIYDDAFTGFVMAAFDENLKGW